MSKPLILVTNDDGILAPGIRYLIKVMKTIGDVVVVAPDKPQSGMGHAITVFSPLRLHKHENDPDIKEYSCSGTPVDCVKIAKDIILHRKPDLIVSGINHGSNASVNIIYSGTMSAALEGSMENIPSIGFSLLDHSQNADFTHTEKYIKNISENVLEKGLPDGVCLNVNFPKISEVPVKGVAVCRQARAYWKEEFDTRKDPHGSNYYWLKGIFENMDGGKDTDEYALSNNYVSIVPVNFDFTDYNTLSTIKKWNLDV
jgi:5'-nucleotidase